MASKPRERVEVAYPGYDTCTLNIITDNLYRAKCGNVQMQASIAWQFFKALGFERPRNWDWSRFKFTATGEPGRPPRHSKKQPVVETYGCTCERDCAGCDLGWHNTCRYGCKNGQPIK